MYCQKCGSELEENCKYCPKCGQSINQATSEKRNNYALVGAIIGLILGFGGCAVWNPYLLDGDGIIWCILGGVLVGILGALVGGFRR